MDRRGEVRAILDVIKTKIPSVEELKEQAPRMLELLKEHGPTALALWPEGEIAALLIAVGLKQANDRGWLEDPKLSVLKRVAVEMAEIYPVDALEAVSKLGKQMAKSDTTRRVSVAVLNSRPGRLAAKLAGIVGSRDREVAQ